ncbi:hypothetical protein T03_16386 [Trichinella britovi]|uniref:Uncharacterized protein n=1 Tax=Trichinella britovi TaxID=45882 RepID=A0A0V1CWX1_TRIBR|nr:hypothetical protein T03_16386 [Trichinella britovi]
MFSSHQHCQNLTEDVAKYEDSLTQQEMHSFVIFCLTCTSVLSVLFLILFPIDRMVVEFIRIEVFLVISVHDAVPHPLSLTNFNYQCSDRYL